MRAQLIEKVPRAEQWADRIRTQLGKSVESILEVGRLLIKAKDDLAHGDAAIRKADEIMGRVYD